MNRTATAILMALLLGGHATSARAAGQALVTVVDPNGPWELEIQMPESRMGHVMRAWNDARRADRDASLPVTFLLATHPESEQSGRLVEIRRAAHGAAGEPRTVTLRVAIDKRELPDLRPGASVTARVHCGRRAIGYVWFHELIAFIQSKILFRL